MDLKDEVMLRVLPIEENVIKNPSLRLFPM
jgi:hypothetical protein